MKRAFPIGPIFHHASLWPTVCNGVMLAMLHANAQALDVSPVFTAPPPSTRCVREARAAGTGGQKNSLQKPDQGEGMTATERESMTSDESVFDPGKSDRPRRQPDRRQTRRRTRTGIHLGGGGG